MHYEINVSLKGAHLFATHERSVTSERQARSLYARFTLAFPESEGFRISVARVSTVGTEFDITAAVQERPTASCLGFKLVKPVFATREAYEAKGHKWDYRLEHIALIDAGKHLNQHDIAFARECGATTLTVTN